MKPIDQEIIKEANEWLNDHGQPSYEKLKRLAETKSPDALELLYELADDYNISYDKDTPPMELVEKIMLRLGEGESIEEGPPPSPK